MFTDIRAVSRWLKSKSCPTTCAVKTGDCVTQDLVQGANSIFDYWVDFWDHLQSNQPPIGDRTEALLAGAPVGAQVQFEYLSGIHLVARARTSSGGPSLDGWSASISKFSTWFRHFFFVASPSWHYLPCSARLAALQRLVSCPSLGLVPCFCRGFC